MIAIDTNVLARLILSDNPAEYSAAVDFVDGNTCFVGWPVLVELCWVLERSARLSRDEVRMGIDFVNRLANVTVPDADGLAWALSRYAEGADFADMVHLVATSAVATIFATFDRKLARQAGLQAPMDIQTLRVAKP